MIARLKNIAIFATFSLLAWQWIWIFAWHSNHAQLPLVLAIVASAPLIISCLMLRKSVHVGLFLASTFALFYFAFAVMEAWANAVARVPALVQVLLTLVIILSYGAAIILEKRASKLAAQPTPLGVNHE